MSGMQPTKKLPVRKIIEHPPVKVMYWDRGFLNKDPALATPKSSQPSLSEFYFPRQERFLPEVEAVKKEDMKPADVKK